MKVPSDETRTDGLVFVRRRRPEKIYLPPRTHDNSFDLKSKAELEHMFGLKVSDWMTLYYYDDGDDYVSEYLPEPER